ncbi:hypothetical protein ACOSQ2_028572 [Xanthoceras sorbifolium]
MDIDAVSEGIQNTLAYDGNKETHDFVDPGPGPNLKPGPEGLRKGSLIENNVQVINPTTKSAKKWKKLAIIANNQVLGPSSPILKLLATRRHGRTGSHSPARKPPNIKLSLSSFPEAGNKRKRDYVLLAENELGLNQAALLIYPLILSSGN